MSAKYYGDAVNIEDCCVNELIQRVMREEGLWPQRCMYGFDYKLGKVNVQWFWSLGGPTFDHPVDYARGKAEQEYLALKIAVRLSR